MRNSISWMDGGVNAAPDERASLAEWRFFISDVNVCLHLDQGDSVDHVMLPMYSLAEGLAHGWWNLFGRRDDELSLVRYRMGYAVPDIRMSFDGAAFDISAQQKIYRNPDVRFWSGPSEVLQRTDAERVLSELIKAVVERLRASGIADTSLERRWNRVVVSWRDDQERAFCEAAGALGLDPYAIEANESESIERASALFEGEPLLEFLNGLRLRDGVPAAVDDRVPAAVDWIHRAEARPRHQARLPQLRESSRRAAIRAPVRAERAWALGYRRARAARQELGFAPGDRIKSHLAAATRLGAPHFKLAGRVDGLTALRSDRDDGVYVHLRRQGDSSHATTSHSFAFARAIGDAFCFPEHGRAVVNVLREASRQAAGRAFAAEFLAPVDEILKMHAEGRDDPSIANEFGVSETLIVRQIENSARIASACN